MKLFLIILCALAFTLVMFWIVIWPERKRWREEERVWKQACHKFEQREQERKERENHAASQS